MQQRFAAQQSIAVKGMSLVPSVFLRDFESAKSNALEVAKEYGGDLPSGRFRCEMIRAEMDI